MKLSTNTGELAEALGHNKAIEIFARSGFDAVDFSFTKNYYTSSVPDSFFVELRKFTEDLGLVFNQAHAPFPSSYTDEKKTEAVFEHITNSMRKAAILGVPHIIVHPCQHLVYDDCGNPEKLFEINMEFYKKLIPYCEEYGIKVALENMWQRPRAICHSTCSRPAEFKKYLDALSNDCFVACLDIGHTELVREKPDDFIRTLGGGYLKCLHVHDVDGANDLHTLPYLGVVNWDKVMKALAEINYEGYLTFEADMIFPKKPTELLPVYAKLMADTGKYLAGKFEEYKAM
jgi:sugar phosphate isomerase/epimerase